MLVTTQYGQIHATLAKRVRNRLGGPKFIGELPDAAVKEAVESRFGLTLCEHDKLNNLSTRLDGELPDEPLRVI